MKVLNRISVAVVMLAGSLARGHGATDAPLPETIFPELDGILRQAVLQSPTMVSRALDLQIAENNRIEARANLLPTLGGYGSYYETRDRRGDLAEPLDVSKIYYNFSINQPLFYWGERRNNARMGEIQANIAKKQYRDAYRQFAQTLRGTYLQLIVLKLAAKRAQFNLDYNRTQLAQEEARWAKKVISDAQIAGVRVATDQAQIASERAAYQFQITKESFARLSGGPVLRDDEIPDSVPVLAHDGAFFDRLLAEYLGEKEPPTTAAEVMRQQLKTLKLAYDIQKVRLRPKFSLVAGNSQDEQSYTLNTALKYKVNSLYGGISVSWSLFDGFAKQAAVRSALARRRQMENDYADLTKKLAQDAQAQVRMISFASRDMAIADRALTDKQGYLKGRQEDFARGTASEADVSLMRLTVFDAEIYAQNIRVDYLTRVAEFLGTVVKDPVTANLANP